MKNITFSVIFLSLFLSQVFCLYQKSARAEDEPFDVIVEKNLFNSERKKWVIEKPLEKKQEPPKTPAKKKMKVSDIEVFGTLNTGEKEYAIIRTKNDKKGSRNRVYMLGDYVSGYLVKKIDRKKVILGDEDTNEEYELFVNEGKKKRSAVKTEIKEDQKVTSSDVKKDKKESPRVKRKKTLTANQLKKRIEKDLKVLRTRKSKLVMRQAEKDLKKLEDLESVLSEKDQDLLRNYKREFDKLKK